ncbi:MAG: BrnT family toxin [Wenzhouxiangellaceae bacterium]|nr:BrnT family toxin [Wenzhouxiangellaceae bacterium]
MMDYEYDEAKSRSNLKKHGIDFLDAQAWWKDPGLLEIRARCEDEPRFLVIGRIGPRHWSAIVTYRNEKIRLISVRRSRASEVELYES